MGFLGLFNRKKDKPNGLKIDVTGIKSSNRGAKASKLNSIASCKALIKENCELIIDSNLQIAEAKIEYQAVTSYLTDMQRIDMIPKEQKTIIEEAAANIINLNKERLKYQNKVSIITDIQYKVLERYELIVPKDLTSLKDSEMYRDMIQKDLQHLEEEKLRLKDEEKDIISKQSFLRGIAIVTCVVMLILFGIFAALATIAKTNMVVPFLLTVLMGLVSVIYIWMESRRNQQDMRLVQLKKNREVHLMNKVKIKAVNNQNYLEYVYSKYMIDSYNELKTLWGEYIKLKEETRTYKNNTEMLDYYNSILIKELKKFGIADSEIWIYQPTAIIDNKEMVEVRHRLNVRRQKLRERMEAYNKQKEEALKEIQEVIKEYPECKDEADVILGKYNIDVR